MPLGAKRKSRLLPGDLAAETQAYFSRITSSIVTGTTAKPLCSGHDSVILTLPATPSAGTRTEPSSVLPHQLSGFSTPRATTGLPAGSALGKRTRPKPGRQVPAAGRPPLGTEIENADHGLAAWQVGDCRQGSPRQQDGIGASLHGGSM